MRCLLSVLLILSLVGCTKGFVKKNTIAKNKDTLKKSKVDVNKESPKTNTLTTNEPQQSICSLKVTDILQLNDTRVQEMFFVKLDSIKKQRYPDELQDSDIMIDLTPEFLNQFITDLDSDILKRTNQFEKEYKLKPATTSSLEDEKCKDKITISFNEQACEFRLEVFTTFLEVSEWCSESMVLYRFQIHDKIISNFYRHEAG